VKKKRKGLGKGNEKVNSGLLAESDNLQRRFLLDKDLEPKHEKGGEEGKKNDLDAKKGLTLLHLPLRQAERKLLDRSKKGPT